MPPAALRGDPLSDRGHFGLRLGAGASGHGPIDGWRRHRRDHLPLLRPLLPDCQSVAGGGAEGHGPAVAARRAVAALGIFA